MSLTLLFLQLVAPIVLACAVLAVLALRRRDADAQADVVHERRVSRPERLVISRI